MKFGLCCGMAVIIGEFRRRGTAGDETLAPLRDDLTRQRRMDVGGSLLAAALRS